MIFKNMKVSQIKRNFQRQILKFNPTLELRMIGTIMKTFRFIYVTSSFYDESAMI